LKPELHITLVQAELQWQQPEANRQHLEALFAAAGTTDLIVLPETFSTGFPGKGYSVAESPGGESSAWLKEMADKYQAVMTGSLVIKQENKFYNRLLWVEPGGETRHYDKRHLFAYAGEDQHFTAGSERRVWSWQGWRVCPQVCYDLRFPVWCRNRDDYDLLVFVANWPAPRKDAWSTLLRARAMENQCYVIGVNRVGICGNGNEYPGLSGIFDPLGRPVAEAGAEEGIIRGAIELAQVGEVRGQFPFQQDADRFRLLD